MEYLTAYATPPLGGWGAYSAVGLNAFSLSIFNFQLSIDYLSLLTIHPSLFPHHQNHLIKQINGSDRQKKEEENRPPL